MDENKSDRKLFMQMRADEGEKGSIFDAIFKRNYTYVHIFMGRYGRYIRVQLFRFKKSYTYTGEELYKRSAALHSHSQCLGSPTRGLSTRVRVSREPN